MAAIRSAADAARYLDGLIDRERMSDAARARSRFDLTAIRALLAAVGDPQEGLSIVHVAGSKGKGTVCLAAEPVLLALGERVGVFTSPHLERWTERFRIDGREVEGRALARAVERLQPAVEALRRDRPEAAPSFFDATTAAALLLFAEAGVDRVLLEVGLGGRLDSTNAVVPRVTCVTQIELEHTAVLGDTLAAIAGEKAGILKPGISCVMGPLVPEAADVVRARAAEVGAPLFALGEHFELDCEPVAGSSDASSGVPRTRLVYREHAASAPGGEPLEIQCVLPVVGLHQARNAGLALACLRQLGEHTPAAFATAAAAGLGRLELPGRIELRAGPPRAVIDSAHTAASARALAEALEALGVRDAELVLSVSRGKALREILASLVGAAGRVTATRADPDRSLPASALAAEIAVEAPGLAVVAEEDPRAALRSAAAAARENGRDVVVAGSVYLAGLAREVLPAGAARDGARR